MKIRQTIEIKSARGTKALIIFWYYFVWKCLQKIRRSGSSGTFHHQKVYISLEDHSFLTSNFSSHFKNDVYWSPDNPSNIKEVRDQGVSKVMAWVGIVDGRVLSITWFQGSVTGQNYLEMLENKVWPAVKSVATKKKYWFQQDGARVHTTNDCLAFLQDKFQGRVISNRLNFFWPAKSPKLNPLDFYF